MTLRAIDLFCGIGGNSWGAQRAGVEIVAGFDKWELAGKVYQDNFPHTRFYQTDLSRLTRSDIRRFQQEIGPVDLILASPECTSHSVARGSRWLYAQKGRPGRVLFLADRLVLRDQAYNTFSPFVIWTGTACTSRRSSSRGPR